jgi:ABC-type glutathione transport system ATPase component
VWHASAKSSCGSSRGEGVELPDRRPDQVSGAESQRIALARALLPDPVFRSADEPSSRLDPITQQETMVDCARFPAIVASRCCW